MSFDTIDHKTLIYHSDFFKGEVQISGRRMSYPWLMEAGFDFRDGTFKKNAWSILVSNLLDKVGNSESFKKKTLRSLREPNKYPNGPFGLDELANAIRILESAPTDEAQVIIGALDICLKIRRFGQNLGIQCRSLEGNDHKDGMTALSEISESKSPIKIMPFWHSLRVCIPMGRSMNFEGEFRDRQRFVPEVEWKMDLLDPMRSVLSQSIEGFYSDTSIVEVGSFFGLPVGMRLHIYDREIDEDRGSTWRRGCMPVQVDEDSLDPHLVLNSDSGAKLAIEYRVESGCPQNVLYTEIDHTIEYAERQRLMLEALRAVAHGMYARAYEKTVANNPHWARIKKKD